MSVLLCTPSGAHRRRLQVVEPSTVPPPLLPVKWAVFTHPTDAAGSRGKREYARVLGFKFGRAMRAAIQMLAIMIYIANWDAEFDVRDFGVLVEIDLV